MKLIKKNIIGELYYDVFQMNDGTRLDVETTKEKYESLSKPNPINPTIKNGIWKFSYSDRKYDTVSGRLENNTYAIDGNQCNIKLADKEFQVHIPGQEMIDDEITTKGLEIINEEIIKVDKKYGNRI